MITPKITDFIVSTNYDQLPERVIEKTKLCITDFLGVALSGSETKSGVAVRGLIKSDAESTIIGHGQASAMEAGLANGIFAHSLDLDDGHRQAQLHPGACIIPAALSLCEARNKSGHEFIESMVVGYQVALLIGMMVNPEHRQRGFHSTGTCGTLGAAAAAAKALNLNEVQTTNTLGLAGTQAAGLLESDHSGSMGKHLHAGKAAQSGILSALLAEKDFSGPETILEGDEGFLRSMAGINPDEMTVNPLNPDVEKFRILEVYFKIYPFCRHLHSSIDALLHIINKNRVKLKELEEINVKTYKIAAEHNNYHPTTEEAVRQSLPISLALMLLNSDQGLNNPLEMNYSPANHISNQMIEDISNKIFIEEDKDFNELYPHQRPANVSIKTNKGIYEKTIYLPCGEPENPLKKSDIVGKFRNLNPNVDMELLRIIDQLERYNNMNHFMDDLNSFLN